MTNSVPICQTIAEASGAMAIFRFFEMAAVRNLGLLKIPI